MSKLTKGQRVRVEFEGVLHTVGGPMDGMIYVSTGRGDFTSWVPVSAITTMEPAHWPPQVGDIWEAGGYEYMIRDARSASNTTRRTLGYDKGYLLVSPLDHAAPTLRGRLDELLAASPKLLRRRGGFSR